MTQVADEVRNHKAELKGIEDATRTLVEEVSRPDEREQVEFVTKRQFLIGGLIVGVTLALTMIALLGFVVIGSAAINDEQDARIADNAYQLHQISIALDGIRKITTPNDREYAQQLRRGFRRCLRTALCRRAFRELANPTKAGGASVLRRPQTNVRTPAGGGAPNAPSRKPSGGGGSKGGGGGRKSPGGGDGGTTPAPSNPAPAPAPAPSPPPPEKPRPPVDIHLAPLPEVCVRPLGGLNCG